MDILAKHRYTCNRCGRQFTRKFSMARHQRDSCPGLQSPASSIQPTWGSLDEEDRSSVTSSIGAAENLIDSEPLADGAFISSATVSDGDDDDDAGDESSQDDEASEDADPEDESGDNDGDDDDATSSDIDPWQNMIAMTYECMQNRFNRRVASYVENEGLAVPNAERVAATELRTAYERTLHDVYEQRLLLNRALHADSTHQKVIATAKRLRDEDEYDAEESLRYAVRRRRFLLNKKLDDYAHPTATLTEERNEDGHVDDAPVMHQGDYQQTWYGGPSLNSRRTQHPGKNPELRD
jgi:hypothetical protein